MSMRLEKLEEGQIIAVGGDQATQVSAELAAAFKPGDHLIVSPHVGVLHVPAAAYEVARRAVGMAVRAFEIVSSLPDQTINAFFDAFARRLGDDPTWNKIAQANEDDVGRAKARGRSTTRLVATDQMRKSMIEGLLQWRDAPAGRQVVERIEHAGWSVEQITAPLGVVAFVFEGRPNVFADATGVLRSGNTVVFRIGSDALGTARAITEHALEPALEEAGLPKGAVGLVDSAEHAAAWALFSDMRLSLAVARGSGPAVDQLGAIARQAGVPVSLHGTGGAWMVADKTADAERFEAVVEASLDRKVCNTLNVCCIVKERAEDLVPRFLKALTSAAERRGQPPKLHVVRGSEAWIPSGWFDREVTVLRAEGAKQEPAAELGDFDSLLAIEWEWEESPEVTLYICSDTRSAIEAFNQFSPQFTASLISEDPEAHEVFYDTINAPFVGDGFTRWVDGQYALNKPELGLSNWERGRLFARGGILSGSGVFTVRTRVRQTNPEVRR